MKFRKGFVTNSSSSSFIAFGVSTWDLPNTLPNEILLKIFKEIYENESWFRDRVDRNEINTDEKRISYINNKIEEDGLADLFYNEMYDITDLEISGYDSDIVGISLFKLIEKYPDKTINEIKEVVCCQINEMFGTSLTIEDIDLIQDVWYNG